MSSVIFKSSFAHPNLKKTRQKNSSHVAYISTRTGVDKSITKRDLENEFGIDYIHKSSIYNDLLDEKGYLKYINERPRSHGLFGESGIEDLKSVQAEIKKHSSFVWRNIISLREEDALRIGFTNKEQWQDMLRKKMPEIAAEIGIKIPNLRWVGAVHMEKGHPHAHVLIWEKIPQIMRGELGSQCINRIRKILTDEIFENERLELLNVKNMTRDMILDDATKLAAEMLDSIDELSNDKRLLFRYLLSDEENTIPPKTDDYTQMILAKKLYELSVMMPGKGRIAYQFMSLEIKQKVDELVDIFIKNPVMGASIAKQLNAVERLVKLYTHKDSAIQKAKDDALNDTKRRISQILLRYAGEINKKNVHVIDKEFLQKTIDVIKRPNERLKKLDHPDNLPKYIDKWRLEKLSLILISGGYSKYRVAEVLSSWADTAINLISKEDLKDIIQTAESIIEKNDTSDMNTVITKEDWEKLFVSLGFDEERIPEWIYRCENYEDFNKNHSDLIICDLWKSIWNSLEYQRKKAEYSFEYFRNQINRQQALSTSKSSKLKQARKAKGASFSKDEHDLNM
jgi:predicted transcriptional regulator YdeE